MQDFAQSGALNQQISEYNESHRATKAVQTRRKTLMIMEIEIAENSAHEGNEDRKDDITFDIGMAAV